MAAYATARASQVRAGDQLWRSSEHGRGFVQSVSRTPAGKVAIEWQDGDVTEHSPNRVFTRKVL